MKHCIFLASKKEKDNEVGPKLRTLINGHYREALTCKKASFRVADVSGLNPSSCAVAHDPKDPQAVNHAILTFQPIPSIPLLQQYSFSVPYLDAYSSICFRFFFWLFLWRCLWAAPSESDIAEGQCGPQLCRGRCCFRPECRFRHPARASATISLPRGRSC